MPSSTLEREAVKPVMDVLGKLTVKEALILMKLVNDIGSKRDKTKEMSDTESVKAIKLIYTLIIAIINSRQE